MVYDPTRFGQGNVFAFGLFNGSDGTLIASKNIASVTRSGTGSYAVLFTTPWINGFYAVTASVSNFEAGSNSTILEMFTEDAQGAITTAPATTGFGLSTIKRGDASPVDADYISFCVTVS